MSIETEILAEVEALKGRFSDTKALYREACALLFFRYGITPTTNKLYQYVPARVKVVVASVTKLTAEYAGDRPPQ
jgi:hypothetical protein